MVVVDGGVCVYVEIYYEKLANLIMEAEIPIICHLELREPGKLVV